MQTTARVPSAQIVGSPMPNSQAVTVCEKHGPYEPKTLTFGGKTIKRGCPVCAEEDALARQRETQEAMKRAAISRAMQEANIPRRYQAKTLDTYRPQSEQAKHAHTWAVKYAENFGRACDLGTSLILTGKPGTGKTHLANGVAHEVIKQGRTARYEPVPDALARIKDTWRKDAQESEGAAIAAYVKPDLLILDEAGVQFGTEAERLILFRMLNRRYEEMRPTILISNLPAEELKAFIGERVMDRFREGGGAVIVFDWDSYRK